MSFQTRLITAFFAAVMMSPIALAAPAAEDSPQINKLLSDLRTQAIGLKEDAARMRAYALVMLPTESHTILVNEVTEHVVTILAQMAALESESSAGTAWQKTAIERVRPFVKELAANTSAVIEIIREHPNEISSEGYRDYIDANNDLSHHLVTLISSFVDYGKAKEKLDRLSHELEFETEDSR
jgi:hypothetical protein